MSINISGRVLHAADRSGLRVCLPSFSFSLLSSSPLTTTCLYVSTVVNLFMVFSHNSHAQNFHECHTKHEAPHVILSVTWRQLFLKQWVTFSELFWHFKNPRYRCSGKFRGKTSFLLFLVNQQPQWYGKSQMSVFPLRVYFFNTHLLHKSQVKISFTGIWTVVRWKVRPEQLLPSS